MNRFMQASIGLVFALFAPFAIAQDAVVPVVAQNGDTVTVSVTGTLSADTTSIVIYDLYQGVPIGNTTPGVDAMLSLDGIADGSLYAVFVVECDSFRFCGPPSISSAPITIGDGGDTGGGDGGGDGGGTVDECTPLDGAVTNVEVEASSVAGAVNVFYEPITGADGYNVYLNGVYIATSETSDALAGGINVGFNPADPDNPLNPFIVEGDTIQVVAYDRDGAVITNRYTPLSCPVTFGDTGGGDGGGDGETVSLELYNQALAEIDVLTENIGYLEQALAECQASDAGVLATDNQVLTDTLAARDQELADATTTIQGLRGAIEACEAQLAQ